MNNLNLRHTPSKKICIKIDTCRRETRSEIHPLGSPAPIHRVTQDQSDSHSLSCWLDDWAAVPVLHCQLFSQPVGQPPCVPPSLPHTSSSVWSARLSVFFKTGFGLRLLFLLLRPTLWLSVTCTRLVYTNEPNECSRHSQVTSFFFFFFFWCHHKYRL